ncbi:MAG TPA: hypothetical protein VKB25_14590 [Conexibacter sp.]|nr:hypothetical protein [Conexibacter sp.]
MKLSKLLLAVVGASVLLGALVSSASAGKLSSSSQTNTVLWRTMNFAGGFGTVECEVRISGSLHTRTFTKTVGSLIGYITEGTILRCSRGSTTINRGSLPWHVRYRDFTGTLPNITGKSGIIIGVEYSIREPLFGITCSVRKENSSTIGTYTISGGTVTRAEPSGTSPCASFTGTLSGAETNVTATLTGTTRITVTLI